MIEFKQVLCPVDLSDASVRSLAHAAAVARWYDAQLTVLHVIPAFESLRVRGELGMPVGPVTSMAREQALDDVRRALDVMVKAPDAVVIAETGDAPTTIVDQAVSRRADLIVMGTHGRRGFKRLVLGSVTETILREAPCPVLTVPQAAHGADPEAVIFKRILCPIDFSPASLQALGFALDLARQADGTVTLLHIVEWLAEEDTVALPHFDATKFRRQLADDAEARLRGLVDKESRTWSELDIAVDFGRAHREILRVAEAKPADLIVMGAQGRGGIGLAVFGSTTQQVVRGAACPVLTVRG